MLYIAITINSAAIIWFLIFLKYSYVGMMIAVSAMVWFFVYLKKKQDQLEANFKKRYCGKTIKQLDKCAIFRAQESNGYSQSQGKGYLVLTDDELYFEMTLLNKSLSIPVVSIFKVGQANRLLGVNPGRPMLKVQYEDSNGTIDSIALSVKNLVAWQQAITTAINENA